MKFLIFVNSFLLAFEPTAWALSKPEQNKIKAFLETSEVSQREVSLQELYKKTTKKLPVGFKKKIKEIVDAYPDAMIPKMSVSKIPALGAAKDNEDVQLTFVTDDKTSGTISFVGRNNVAVQINGVKVSFDEIQDLEKLSEKIIEAFPLSTYAKQTKYKEKDFGLLTAENINVLNLEEKRQYFRKYQQLLETMEKLNGLGAVDNKKTSQLIFDSIIPSAEAASRQPRDAKEAAALNIKNPDSAKSQGLKCIYAGHLADYGYKIEGADYNPASDKRDYHVSCGGGESDFYKNFQKPLLNCNDQAGFITCNTFVFGGSPKVCVPEKDIQSTAKCVEQAKKYDAFPREIKNKADFDQAKLDIENELRNLNKICKNEIMGSKNKHLPDQKSTCEELTQRIDEILALTCGNLETAHKAGETKRFPNLKCEAEPGQGAGPIQQPAPPSDDKDCKGYYKDDVLPGIKIAKDCVSSESISAGGVLQRCNKSWVRCECTKGGEVGDGSRTGPVMSCMTKAASDPVSQKPTKKPSKVKASDWLVPGLIALIGIGGLWAWSRSFKDGPSTGTPADPAPSVPTLNLRSNRSTTK